MKAPLLMLAVLVPLAGCSLGGGISRDRAIELALAGASDDAQVARVQRGELGEFAGPNTLPDQARDREVWAVVLKGTFPGSCVVTAVGGSACAPDAETMLVVLDGRSGELLYAMAPAIDSRPGQ